MPQTHLYTRKAAIFVLFLFACIYTCKISAQPCYEFRNNKTHYRFRILKSGLHIDTFKIKTTGVYISEYKNDEEGKYSFFRFFDNGKVFISKPYCSKPSQEELNDLYYGEYGYYRVDSNVVTIETFYHNGKLGTRFYVASFYKIKSDGIYVYATEQREMIKGHPIATTWPNLKTNYFYSCELKNIQPFW